MDTTTVLAAAALCVSTLALLASSVLAVWQLKLVRQANHVPALLAMFSELRSATFHRHYNYVVYSLSSDHDAALGIFGLPKEAQEAVLDVAYHYQAFVNLVKFGILDEDKVLGAMRMRIIHSWTAIEPYVTTERDKHPDSAPRMLAILEEYALRAKELST